MNWQQLMDTARAFVAADQGLPAMDESHPTCNKRFAKLGKWRGVGLRFNFHGDFL